ncbi:MAG: hypothetical protein AAB295_01860 [Chloroflexota bacterium]
MPALGALLAWILIAFSLWVILTAVFALLRVPAPAAVAAVLGWIAAGLFVTWAAPFVG